MPRLPAATVALALLAAAPPAGEPARFLRTPDLSPDGRLVAFSYLGDVWLVEAIGGVARQLTQHEAHEINPSFSPDGRLVAFSSNRHGSYDVFVAPVHGGRPTRLTFDSAADMVCGWTPDGSAVLFTTQRGPAFPPAPDLMAVPAGGGRERLVMADAKDGALSPTGGRLAYARGPGLWYRKGYRGSANDDIWVCSPDGTGHCRVTDFAGQDGSPAWSADGRTLFYVTEQFGGPANLAAVDPASNAPPRQLTRHTHDAVRRARVGGGGAWLVYECGPDVWLVPAAGGEPRRLAVEAYADDKANTERAVTFTRSATEYALSPDESHAALVVHGELFLVPGGGGKATRLTDSPAYDHGVAWSPDGRSLVFASDRTGHEDLYRLQAADAYITDLTKSKTFKVTPLTATPEAESGASFSPDGRRLAFLRAGRLWTMKPDGTDAKQLPGDAGVFDYDWSPDGKWLALARSDGSFASEVYVAPADGSAPPRNVTRYATYNADVTWSQTGGRLAFLSQRRGTTSVYTLPLAAADEPGAAAAGIDFDDIHLRAVRAAAVPAENAAVSPDGIKVAFRSTSNGDDLWVAAAGGGELTRATTGGLKPTQIRWSRRRAGTVFFLDGTGTVRSYKPGGDLGRLAFEAKMVVRQAEESLEMFDQAWRALHDSFYDAAFHGADWKAVRAKYRPLVAHTARKEDLYALVALMLGELNASHLGVSGPAAAPEEPTADLGLVFDRTYAGPGLKVADVLRRGPADVRGLKLAAGDVVTAIDGEPLTDAVNVSGLLNGKAGETVTLEVLDGKAADGRDPKAKRKVKVKPAAREKVQDLAYERWVALNAARVDKEGGGRLGYVHIPSMDEDGLERFVRSLYSDNFDKDALVIDVRYNGGGFTHDQVLNYLTGREHTVFRHRTGNQGWVLRSGDRKWTRPAVVLMNNRSYSDAEIFPSAFRAHGLGKLVGQPTGGAVIGTASVKLIEGSTFRVPRIGVYTAAGVNMEKEGVRPDVLVEPHPEDALAGRDAQLDKAVEVLRAEVAAKKAGVRGEE